MEMHELEQAWNGLDQRLARQDTRLRQMEVRRGVRSARSRLHLVSLGQLLQLVIGVAVVLWAGGYWVGKLGQVHLVVYGIAIHLYGLALAISAGFQMWRVSRIDPRRPVLDVQRELVSLRRLRATSERALLMLGFVVWVPLVFVLAHAGGMDVWQSSPATVLANLGVSLGLAALVGWLTHRYRDAFERDAAGRSLRAAEQELAELGAE